MGVKKVLRVKKSGSALVAEDLKVKSGVKAGVVGEVSVYRRSPNPVDLTALQQIRVIYYK